MREAPERGLEEVGDRGLAEEADAQRGERDAELAGREVLAEVVELLDDEPGAAVTLGGELLQRARRARTSANSAATKKPLAKISTMTALSRSAVKRRECGRA